MTLAATLGAVADTGAQSPRGTIENLRLTSPNAGELVINWDAPSQTPTDYRVVYAPADQSFPSFRDANTAAKGNAYPTVNTHTVADLPHGAEYKVLVRARYSDGHPRGGPWSDQAVITISSSPKPTPEPQRDATPVPTATIAASNAAITEGGNAVFTVTLKPAPSSDVSVSYNLAVTGDYGVSVPENRTATVSSGKTTATITFATDDDDVDETNGGVTVLLAAGAGYAVGAANSATVTVNDNDEPATANQVSGQAAADFIPTGFRTGLFNNGVRFEWNAPPSGTVRSYELKWDRDANPSDTSEATVTVVGDATRRSDAARNVGANTTVWAYVRAQDDSDGTWGPWSHVLKGTGNREEDRVLPGQPAAPTVTAGDGQLTVAWSAPATDGGNTIYEYFLRYIRTDATDKSDSQWTSPEIGGNNRAYPVWSIGDGNREYAITGLTNGVSYDVQVAAKTVVGIGSYSATAAGTPATSGTDYDTNDNGLIEVDSLAKLNAVRWDPEGDGAVDGSSSEKANYAAAFPNPLPRMGCPGVRCTGYELTTNLDFDTGTSGDRSDDAFANVDDMGNTDTNDDVTRGWDPIGRFTGTFEGNNNTISNLFINRDTSDRLGLFARLGDDTANPAVGATIRNLVLTGASVTGDDYLGILAGRTYGPTSISNVTVNGSVTGTRSGSDAIGGLIGQTSDDTTISGVSASGSAASIGDEVGGLVGYNIGDISDSYSSAAVSGVDKIGGLVGENPGSILGSYASGTVSGSGMDLGGLVGSNIGGDITASYATGSVGSATSSDVGGLVGDNAGGAIIASYATGVVSGSGTVGGLVGYNGGTGGQPIGTITNSYWDTESSGQTTSAGGTGKTGVELRAPTGYTGIYANWNIDLNGDSTADDPWDFGRVQHYPMRKGAPRLTFNNTAVDNPATVLERWSPVHQRLTAWEMNLSQKPASNVVVSVTSSDPAHVTVDADDNGTFATSETFTLTPSNWECVQRLTGGECIGHFIALKAESDEDGDVETLTITISVVEAQSDPAFRGMPDIVIQAQTWDDEYQCSRDPDWACEGEFN